MSQQKPLSIEEAARLLALPTRRSRTDASGTMVTIPGASKSVRVDLTVRTFPMWWKLPTTRTDCQVSIHDEEEASRNRMCYEIKGIMVCRYCYVNGRDLA